MASDQEYSKRLNPNPMVTVDNCIDLLLPPTNFNNIILFRQVQDSIFVEFDPLINALRQLFIDGYLIEYPSNANIYHLTAAGRKFLMNGGYANLFTEEARIKKLNESQLQSVIDTNISIQKTNDDTRTNIGIQKRLTITALVIAGVSLVSSIISVIASCNDKTDARLLKIDSTLQQQRTLLLPVQHIDTSLQNIGKKQFLKYADTLNVFQVK